MNSTTVKTKLKQYKTEKAGNNQGRPSSSSGSKITNTDDNYTFTKSNYVI